MDYKFNPIDFWGIGAQKSGTTWLQSNLRKIPTFDLPPIKEFHYFDRSPDYPSPSIILPNQNLSLSDKITGVKKILRAKFKRQNRKSNFFKKWYFGEYSAHWYTSLFSEYNSITGEITPSYSILQIEDIQRMFEISPKAKLIFLVRNPIDRAWSHYRYHNSLANKKMDTHVATSEIMDFMHSDNQVLRSDYISTIERFTAVFPEGSLLIGFYDAIQQCPQELIDEIYNFLTNSDSGVQVKLNLNQVINKSTTVSCPEEVKQELKKIYLPHITKLAENHGGYFKHWLDCTNNSQITPDSPRPKSIII